MWMQAREQQRREVVKRGHALYRARQKSSAKLIGIMHQVQFQFADQPLVRNVEQPQSAIGLGRMQKDAADPSVAINVKHSAAKPDKKVLIHRVDQQQVL